MWEYLKINEKWIIPDLRINSSFRLAFFSQTIFILLALIFPPIYSTLNPLLCLTMFSVRLKYLSRLMLLTGLKKKFEINNTWGGLRKAELCCSNLIMKYIFKIIHTYAERKWMIRQEDLRFSPSYIREFLTPLELNREWHLEFSVEGN